MISAIANNAVLASFVAAVLSLVSAFLGLDALRWEGRIRVRHREHEVRARLVSEHYDQRPRGTELYAFAPLLALRRPMRRRFHRLAARSRIAGGLPVVQYEQGCELALRWVSTVGVMAKLACYREQVPLRRFLQTYHLGVIREGSLALPFVVCLARTGRLTPEGLDHAAAGVALMELAARYNSLARQQRQPVYFLSKTDAAPLGPVVRAPRRLRLLWLTPLDLVSKSLRLRPYRIALARRLVSRLAATELSTPLTGSSPPGIPAPGQTEGSVNLRPEDA